MVCEIARIFGFAVASTKETQKKMLEMPPSPRKKKAEVSYKATRAWPGMAFGAAFL